MKIIWLEDETDTISVIKKMIQRELQTPIKICKSFATFSDNIEELEDKKDEVIIIDVRMFFNIEIEFSCFKKSFKIYEQHDSGFEYFNQCIRDRFKNLHVIFFTSKPELKAKEDAKRYGIDTDLIVSKDYTTRLIDILKDIKKEIL